MSTATAFLAPLPYSTRRAMKASKARKSRPTVKPVDPRVNELLALFIDFDRRTSNIARLEAEGTPISNAEIDQCCRAERGCRPDCC